MNRLSWCVPPLLLLAGCGSERSSKEQDDATQQVYYQIAAQMRAQNSKILALEVKVADLQARLDAQERTTNEMLGKQMLFKPIRP